MTARPQDVALLPPLDPLPEDYKPREWECTHQAATYFYQEGHAAALASAQAREEELRVALMLEKAGAEHERIRMTCRIERLEEALRELADANFEEFCGEGTEEMEPDDSKVSYPEDRCHITFGMIRRARALLSTNAATQTGETNEAAE